MTVTRPVGANASRGPDGSGRGSRAGPGAAGRLHWIDWLRLAAIAGVFTYHSLRPFNTDGWHVKNLETSAALNVVMTLFSSFGLAVLFLLAGAGMRFALRKRSLRTFIHERTVRLLVPFAIGTAVLSPFQGFLQARQQEAYTGSYLEFLGVWAQRLPGDITERFSPTVFGIGYHLWFLGFLFAISIIALPICEWLLSERGRAFVDALARHLAWPGSSLAFVVPIYLLMGLGSLLGTAEHDWFEFTWYFAYLVAGFVLLGDERLIDAVQRDLWALLAVAVVTTALIVAGVPVPLDGLGSADVPTKLVTGGLFALEGWAWTLVILNVGLRSARFQRPVSEPVGDAVLPVYVIHQPVILAVAFVVVSWPLAILAKWVVVFAVSLPVTLVLVELGLRTPITRGLLGARVRSTTPISAPGLATAGPDTLSPAATIGHGRAR